MGPGPNGEEFIVEPEDTGKLMALLAILHDHTAVAFMKDALTSQPLATKLISGLLLVEMIEHISFADADAITRDSPRERAVMCNCSNDEHPSNVFDDTLAWPHDPNDENAVCYRMTEGGMRFFHLAEAAWIMAQRDEARRAGPPPPFSMN